jgi:hypothetical protein
MAKYVKYVVLASIIALGFAWFQGRHATAAADQHAFANIASELARRPVHVNCQGFVGASVDVSPEAGWVPFDASGRPGDHTNLKRDMCAALARYPADSKSAAFECVVRDVPCSHRIYNDVQAVHVLAHESEHLAGQASEALAECRSLRTTAYVAIRLGSDPAQAAAVAQFYYRHIYPQLPEEYRSANCSP